MTRHVFRFFVDAAGAAGAEVELEAADRRHAERVLRLRPGDPLEVSDAAGAVWEAELAAAGQVRLLGLREAPPPAAGGCTVWLALAGSRSDLAVEKLTELGVAAIGPLRSERARGTARPERWERVALAAAKQSKRARPPAVLRAASLAEVLAGPPAVMLDHEAPDARPFRAGASSAFLVGPEAGWSESEREAARAAGAALCRLPGRGVLRSETAAIVAATLMLVSREDAVR